MTHQTAVIRTESQRVRLLSCISNEPLDLPLEVRWGPWKEDRSARQNRLSHAWYREIADRKGDMTPDEVRHFCKLHYGVPILRGDDPEYCDAYDGAIKPLAYEQKLKAMRYWPVTRLMNVDQMTSYLEAMERGWGEAGVWLDDEIP